MARLITLIILFVGLLSCQSNKELVIEFGTAPSSAVFESDSFHIWGASLTKGNDGLYHMYYSRWPKSHSAHWTTDSEIAHAVSESPYGPFQHRDVTLPARGADFWDGMCTHNPTIHEFNGRYYLYYMGNTGDEKKPSTPTKPTINWVHRNNQRIGVAVATNPNGPWERFDEPLIDVSPDSTAHDALLVSNPSVTLRPDGGYLMVYKAAGKKRKGIAGGPVVHCVATSDSPTGPFKKHDLPVFTAEGHDFPAEDPFIFYYGGKYRAIVKDMHGAFIEAGKSLVYFESKDGYDWKLDSTNPLASKLQIKWEDKGIKQVDFLERPQIYIEDGKPTAILCAALTYTDDGREILRNVQIPLIIKELDKKTKD
ncbi:hypothetical protein [uncultured Draconibacterium sp.]|uniref:hypothetical protein n=1 Tax=uncultured Draconibacterium sp. TaxID=1573823 RepID=UPI0025D35EEE|nr:hypothetical protein [uncultured Draconibacterium sp.]